MYDLSNIIAMAYLCYSHQSISDVIKENKFNPLKYFRTIIECDKCLAFWVVFATTQNLQFALLVSLAVLLMQSFIVTKL